MDTFEDLCELRDELRICLPELAVDGILDELSVEGCCDPRNGISLDTIPLIEG